MASRRRLARIAVMQTLFELDFCSQHGKESKRMPEEILKRNIAEAGEEQVDRAFAEKLLQGLWAHAAGILSHIAKHAPEWPLERMDRMSRCLLMIGAYELLFGKDAPAAVAMDEAIEIAKEFGEEESGKFVNGVLNAIAHASREGVSE